MGGGRRHFLPNTVVDPEKNTIDGKQRLDGRNLVQVYYTYHCKTPKFGGS